MLDKGEIRGFIREKLNSIGDTQPVSDGESLLTSGRLQSIDAVDIVVFLEERYGIDFAEIGFDQEQIDSIDVIHALAASKSSRL